MRLFIVSEPIADRFPWTPCTFVYAWIDGATLTASSARAAEAAIDAAIASGAAMARSFLTDPPWDTCEASRATGSRLPSALGLPAGTPCSNDHEQLLLTFR